MTVPAIHVHTQVDKSTVPYAKFMWETMLSLASRPELLTITVHCMGPTAAARSDAWISGKGKAIVVPDKKGDPLNGSKGHGACVMSALAETGDGNIHVICDSDTVVVARGWDDYLRQRLLSDELSIIGSTYEDLGGFSSGASTVQTYKKVPSLTWCALSPMHDWRALNVMPNKGHQVGITTDQLSRIYNLPIGYSVFGEVGWQLPQYLYDNALKYDGWRQLKPSKDAVILKGLSDYHEEFHAGDTPFVAHHRGSMRHAFRGDRISQQFYGAVDAYLAKETAGHPRWKWLEAQGETLVIPKFLELSPTPPPTSPEVSSGPRPEVQAEAFTPKNREWLKVSCNGKVLRARSDVRRADIVKQLDFVPQANTIHHIRVEGALEFIYPIVVPPTDSVPYMVTCRNAAGAELSVGCGRGQTVEVPPGKTWWLLVDIDGVQRVE